LTFAVIEIAKLLDQIAVASGGLGHEIATAFLGHASRFVLEEPSYGFFIASEQQCFQPLLGKQPSARFK
jgi:hypothetical protein